jgi:poly-gamma-glutamate synthesis protein (capsule biosynthesis protein)
MTFALVGDVMLGRLVNKTLKTSDSAYPWGNTLSILQNADLRICNLECVLSNIGRPWSNTPKMFHFRSDEKNVQALIAAKIDFVSIANNHVLDYEEDALMRMLKVLQENKIHHSGSGRNIQEASQHTICHVREYKIGFIAFTDNQSDWEALEKVPGVFYVPIDIDDKRAKVLFQSVEVLHEQVDFLIISAHWGPNWGEDPPKEQVPFAHALIDAGADIIFGHSGHIFRGIEIYNHRPIIYCAGDFIDDYAVDEIERNDESFIFLVEIEEKQISKIILHPTIIRNFQANLATGSRQREILSKMKHLCENLGTQMNCTTNSAFGEIIVSK